MEDCKRKYVRVNYPCAITVWKQDGASEVIMANTANISGGGICVFLNEALVMDTLIDVRIDNFFEANPLKFRGKVVRCKADSTATNSRQKFYEVGVEFIAIDDDQRAYLLGFIQRLIDLEEKHKR